MPLAIFATSVAATMIDPLSLLGWVIAGVSLRNLWIALAVGAGWSIAMEVLVASLNHGYAGQFAVARLVAGCIVTAACWGIRYWFRQSASRIDV